MQKYGLFIFFFFWRNIMSFLRPKYFFTESLIFALSNEVQFYKELDITAEI